MDRLFYSDLLRELVAVAENFSIDDSLREEVEEDFSSIEEVIDICGRRLNVDGVVKNVPEILKELAQANREGDRQKCLNSIAMLRCAIADIASAFSNAMDSMENLVVAIRDDE
ncbi:hypothetical protein EB809_12770 [Marinobacter sp. R17]|uniref:hypothetical protein n=1 Tax=Marinobacter sp. R17 TaxID=2484250 RepID=UPI000F4BC9FF|nr:hypothetical protein [Marinobacter sp. R17]ROT98919.1 hypothetical protein EB809_12770 [Marinobacter sp. R17]